MCRAISFLKKYYDNTIYLIVLNTMFKSIELYKYKYKVSNLNFLLLLNTNFFRECHFDRYLTMRVWGMHTCVMDKNVCSQVVDK